MSTCILIPTFPKYRKIAEHTGAQISKLWAVHPMVYFAGCHDRGGDSWLECQDDKASWIDVMLEAILQLLDKGHKWVYVILDDHPPLGVCNENFLNVDLPRIAEDLDSTVINLLGCDQGQGRVGEKFFVAGIEIEQCAANYAYRFSLHPALWNLEKLRQTLEASKHYAHENGLGASPWTFEKTVLDNQYLDEELKRGCFRICGSKYTARKFDWWILRRKWKIRMIGKRLGFDWMPDLEFWYEGPYPMVWSGMMRAGKVSDCYERVLEKYGDKESVEGFRMGRFYHE